jgi:hypothetical protein
MITLGGKSSNTAMQLYQLALTEYALLVAKQNIVLALEKNSFAEQGLVKN